jgi:molecular chaperone GrpE
MTPQKHMTNTPKSAKPDIKDQAQLELANLKDRLGRALADYHNLEARTKRDSATIIKFANQSLLEKLLEVKDHLTLASQNGDQSLNLILTNFDKILESEGVTVISTKGSFDPHCMECAEEVSGEKDQIIDTLRPGYMLHDRVLRFARVTVGSGVQGHSSTGDLTSSGDTP